MGGKHGYAASSWGRVLRYLLADIRRLRKCGDRRGLSGVGHRIPRGQLCLRTDRTHNGLCGHISGGHFNSAVTIGLWAGGRFKATDVIPYILAQVVGAIAAAAVLYLIASGKSDWVPGGFASNGYGDLSPGKYNLTSCFLIEVLATFFFLYVIIGTTSKGAAVGFAGIPIGLCLTLIHLFLIPVTNASVNPARSTGPALFAGGAYIAQLWLFWLAPILGAAIAGLISRWQHEAPDAST
jgi:aquaporin Z